MMSHAAQPGKSTTRATLETFNWSVGLRTFYDALCGTGTFVFTGFALALGLPREQMGNIMALVYLASLTQVIALMVLNRITEKKRFVVLVGVFEPLTVLLMLLLLPFIPAGARLWVLGAGIFLAAGAAHLVRPIGDNWFASAIPESLRARYLSVRFQIIAILAIVVTLSAGYLAKIIPPGHPAPFAMLLAAGCVFGIGSAVWLSRAAMPAISTEARVQWRDVGEAFRTPAFRRYLFGFLLYNLPFMPANAYYQVFNMTVLHMTTDLIAWMSIGYQALKFIATPFAGRIIERWGVRTALLWCGPLYAAFFLAFIVCTPHRVWPLMLAWTLVALGDAVFSIAGVAALYAAVPQTPARPVFFAINNLVMLGAFALMARLVVPVLQTLKPATLTLGPLTLGQFHIFYLLIGLSMLPLTLGALLLPGKKGKDRGDG